mgnify:CR=1 FL=1
MDYKTFRLAEVKTSREQSAVDAALLDEIAAALV